MASGHNYSAEKRAQTSSSNQTNPARLYSQHSDQYVHSSQQLSQQYPVHSQPNMCIQGDSYAPTLNSHMPIFTTFSQPMQQVYPQQPIIYNSQPQNWIIQSENMPTTSTTNDWRTVNRKRQRLSEDQDNQHSKKQQYWLGESIPTSNRYSSLSEEQMDNGDKPKTEPKPPPIFISEVKNINPLHELLEEIAKDKYTLKSLYNEQVKIQPTESATYTLIIKALVDKNTKFHTYKPKAERSFRVVLKNLHPTTDVNEIKKSLADKGHEVTNIWNVKRKTTNIPLPIHFLDLKPNENNSEIYKIDLLLHTKVQFEAPHPRREIIQCTRCQKFGHTKNYCRNTPRCVKCTAEHHTQECSRKTKDNDVQCVNCHGSHPANYKGCAIHIQLQQKTYPRLRERQIRHRTTQPGLSYACATQSQPETPPSNGNQQTIIPIIQPNNDLAELKQMMKNLMDQMGTLINLMSMLITNKQ